MVWHRETELPDGLDLIAIPGGFSYGDYLRGDGMHAIFAFSNVLALGYGLVALIGLRAIGEDVVNAIMRLTRKLVPGPTPRPAEELTVMEAPVRLVARDLIARDLARPTQGQAPSFRSLSTAELPYVSGAALQPVRDVANDRRSPSRGLRS